MASGTLSRTTSELTTSLGRISSGLRITQAADDAAGLGVATNLEAISISTSQAMRNANDGISIIQTAEGASNEVIDILQRMRELATQSSSETLANTERSYIQDEFVQLRSEMSRIASVTEFNGIQLTDGSDTTLNVQVGVENDSSSLIQITLGELAPNVLGLLGLNKDVLTVVNARTLLDDIDSALDTVNGYRAELGAAQNRLDNALNNS